MIFSIGDQTFNGDYTLHSVFNRVVNFSSHGQLLSICNSEAGNGPSSIVVDDRLLDSFKDLNSVSICDGVMHLQGRYLNSTLRLPREIYTSEATLLMIDNETLNTNINHVKARALSRDQKSLLFLLDSNLEKHFTGAFDLELIRRFKKTIDKVFSLTELDEGIQQIKGLGPGLTPSGDDFNVGVIASIHITQHLENTKLPHILQILRNNVFGENPFSNSYLKYALINTYSEKLKNLIEAISSPTDVDNLNLSTDELMNFGASSGADVLAGLILGLQRRKAWLQKD